MSQGNKESNVFKGISNLISELSGNWVGDFVIYNHLNTNNMNKEMNWGTFVPTREIREYDMKLRESIRQREQLNMLTTGIKYFNTCSEYWLYKVESEYIKAEIAAEKSQE